MHEIGIVQGALEMALRTAEEAKAKAIECVRMRVGAMTGVVPEALQFAFEALREGTLAEGARLEIETTPARCWCAACQVEFESADWQQRCPHCQTHSAELRQGLELELISIEIS